MFYLDVLGLNTLEKSKLQHAISTNMVECDFLIFLFPFTSVLNYVVCHHDKKYECIHNMNTKYIKIRIFLQDMFSYSHRIMDRIINIKHISPKTLICVILPLKVVIYFRGKEVCKLINHH